MGENFYWASSVGALLIGVLYYWIWPKPANPAHAQARSVILRCVLRFGHSGVWLLLAVFFMGKTGRLGQSAEFWQSFGLSAFCLYGLFLLACFYDRKKVRGA